MQRQAISVEEFDKWVNLPENNEKVKIYKKTDTLIGGKVLQGFSLDLKNLFP